MFQTEKNKTIFILIAILIIIGGYFLWHQSSGQTNNSSIATSTNQYGPGYVGTSTEEYIKYVGVISQNASGQNVYTSTKYQLSFSYPQGWNVWDNHLGYGTFQLFNFEPELGQKGYGEGQNKIEAVILMGSPNIRDFGDKFIDSPKEFVTTKEVSVAGEVAIRYDVNYPAGGITSISYIIPFPNIPGKYFAISIGGDPSNFYVLDDLVKSIEWVK